MHSIHYDTIILGGGPAGLTAGIYLSRARIKTLILNEGTIGGQLVLTHEIANYPGVEHISGYQLSSIMRKQGKEFGCDIKANLTINSVDFSAEPKQVHLSDGRIFTSDSIIIATGGRSRTLGVSGETELKGKGISYCATCDGDFFTDKEIIVVGGGNSALEEAVSLTKYASKVTIVHQFDHFQAFEHAIKEAQNHPKIDFIMESTIAEFFGEEKLQAVDIKHIPSGTIERRLIDGVFVFIGYIPNTEWLTDEIALNTRSEIIVNSDLQTSVEGVFAAGDSIAKKYRQVTTAVSDGTIAALAASEYLHNKKTAELSELVSI